MDIFKEFNKRFDEAIKQNYTYDRLSTLEDLLADVSKLGDVSKKVEFRQAGLGVLAGLGATILLLPTTVIASIVISPLVAPPLAGIPLLIGGTVGGIASYIYVGTSEKVNNWLAERYERKNSEELSALRDLGDKLEKALEAEYGFIDGMTAEGAAGLVHLDKITDEFPRAREALVDIFRLSVREPVLEQSVCGTEETPAARAVLQPR